MNLVKYEPQQALVPSKAGPKKGEKQTWQLPGHEAAVYSLDFSPSGRFLASAGFDRKVLVWRVEASDQINQQSDEEFKPTTLGIPLKEHTNSVLGILWPKIPGQSDHTTLYSCGALNTKRKRGELFQWDLHKFERVRQFHGHKEIVNSIDYGKETLASASDDGTVKLWDSRSKQPSHSFEFEGIPQTCIALSKDEQFAYCGGVDNQIKALNLRTSKVDFTMFGHHDTVSSLSLSPSGTHLVSNGMESLNFDPAGPSLFMWDVRPFLPNAKANQSQFREPTGRFIGNLAGLQGPQANQRRTQDQERNTIKCHWSSPVGENTTGGNYVSVGASNAQGRSLYIWNAQKGSLAHQLSGHKGSVNCVRIAEGPSKTLVASGSSDKTIIIGEIP